ncbi:MAG: phosphatidylinositol-3,5-bisphosphate 5-phosphatase [Stictis urceolatum]|nr:phosphatidylinositol-3,5-bisphosphate 5-phosphatase [Stictis urceolata]
MAKRLVRYVVAGFTALIITLSLYNGATVRDRIAHAGPLIRPHVVSNSKWAKLPVEYPVESYIRIPSGPPRNIPKIQHEFMPETDSAKVARTEKLGKIKESFQHAWKGYKNHAWLSDELEPVTGGQLNVFGGWAATLVDSLDTLWIMDLKDEFDEAVNATNSIDFSQAAVETLNVFETTIRYMGGFLAAYDLSGRRELLEKAVELGEMIYVAFDTPNRLPVMRWRWQHKLEGEPQHASAATLSAEIGSLSLELTRLTQLTGDPKYFDAIQRITDVFDEQQDSTALPGLWPIGVDAEEPNFAIEKQFSLGAMADSLYEYLPKEYMLLGGNADQYRRMYEKAIEVAKRKLFFRPMIPTEQDVLMSGIWEPDRSPDHGGASMVLRPEGQHLVCFVGGMVGIAAKIFSREEDLSIARKLTDGCIWAYEGSPNGIMPEVFSVLPCEDPSECKWNEKKWKDKIDERSGRRDPDSDYVTKHRLPPGITQIRDRRYVLRPEAIESVMIMYRITGDLVLQDKGWEMFKAIEKATRTEFAHATLNDVTDKTNEKQDKMESFWTAETLKYFYLLFSEPSVISLDEWVFNTEAHGFRRPISR